MSPYIHGQTDPREVARLEKQARFCAPLILEGFDAAPGMQVLDLATGVGAMAGQLLERFPGIRLAAVDLNPNQLRCAVKNHPGPAYVQGDGARLPFADGTFDRVHCSWMLEHVRRPVEVLREVRRVLKAPGYCHFTEVENASFYTSPQYPEVIEAMRALNDVQVRGGGDPYIGRRLDALLREAQLSDVVVRPSVYRGTHEDPAFYRAFADEFAEIFESLDEALGPAMIGTLRAAALRLRELPNVPGSEMYYRGFIAQGRKP